MLWCIVQILGRRPCSPEAYLIEPEHVFFGLDNIVKAYMELVETGDGEGRFPYLKIPSQNYFPLKMSLL